MVYCLLWPNGDIQLVGSEGKKNASMELLIDAVGDARGALLVRLTGTSNVCIDHEYDSENREKRTGRMEIGNNPEGMFQRLPFCLMKDGMTATPASDEEVRAWFDENKEHWHYADEDELPEAKAEQSCSA